MYQQLKFSTDQGEVTCTERIPWASHDLTPVTYKKGLGILSMGALLTS